MNRTILIFVGICLIQASGIGQTLVVSDSLVRVNSQIRSVYADQPVINAHIINPGLNVGTTSDSLGFFTIYMKRTDSLQISAISFEELSFSLPGFWPSSDYSKTIYIKETAYLIEEVYIHGLGSYQQFKQKVLDARPPEPPAERTRKYVEEMATKEATDWDRVRVGFNFSIKTREERSRKKLEKILAEIEKRKSIERKFNVQNVGELTGLSGNELDQFMRYCNFSENFLLVSTEYTILSAVKQRFEKYRQQDIPRDVEQ